MAKGAQCGEDGPFFATTPRSVIQNGMAIDTTILITPDWLLIGLMLACFFVLILILVLGLVSRHYIFLFPFLAFVTDFLLTYFLCNFVIWPSKKECLMNVPLLVWLHQVYPMQCSFCFVFQFMFRTHGWRKTLYLDPKYRIATQVYNFDEYSSKGSAVHPLKKYHQTKMVIEHLQKLPIKTEGNEQGSIFKRVTCAFWICRIYCLFQVFVHEQIRFSSHLPLLLWVNSGYHCYLFI